MYTGLSERTSSIAYRSQTDLDTASNTSCSAEILKMAVGSVIELALRVAGGELRVRFPKSTIISPINTELRPVQVLTHSFSGSSSEWVCCGHASRTSCITFSNMVSYTYNCRHVFQHEMELKTGCSARKHIESLFHGRSFSCDVTLILRN